MLYFYFCSVLCIFKISSQSSTSIYELLKRMLFNFQVLGDFPHIFLLLTSNLISLWLEDIHCMIFILLNLLRFVLWPRIYIQPSISLGSISGNSTNHRSKIFEKKKKIPESSKKQNLSLPHGLTTIYRAFTLCWVL